MAVVSWRRQRRPRLRESTTHVSQPSMNFALGSADYSWRKHALCRDTNPELFFPVGNTGAALIQISEAKSVCGKCSVAPQCLEFALETSQDCGIWGGLTEDERRTIKRTRLAERRAAR